jgi:hypothetical protein
MSSKVKNYLIVLLALATVSASLIAWTQSRRLAALEADLLKASTAAAAVKPKSAPVAAEFTAKPPGLITVTPADGEAATPADEAAGQNRQRNNRPNFAALMANPEFAKAMAIQQRAGLDARYADLFKQLKLSPAQLEKFKDLLVERQTARMDVMATAREQGLDPRANRDELKKMTDEAQAEVDASIKTTLGESVYNQYQTYDATQSQRALVSQVNNILGYSSTPLNETQSAFLITALGTGATATADQGGGPGGWGGATNRATITDAVIEQAQAVLFPAQVEVLKQVQAEQQAQQKVRELMRASGGNTGGNTGATRQRN